MSNLKASESKIKQSEAVLSFAILFFRHESQERSNFTHEGQERSENEVLHNLQKRLKRSDCNALRHLATKISKNKIAQLKNK